MNQENTQTQDQGYLENNGRFKGLFSWIFSTDHKRIGLLYLYTIMFFFLF